MKGAIPQGALLHIEDLSQGFGGKVVLDNVDVSVQAGELVTLVGPSGCGKSTLLRIIIGQDVPLSGRVLLDGQPLKRPGVERGVVYQHYSLFPHLTALDNVLAGHRLAVWPWQWPAVRKRHRDEAMAFLERAGIAEHHGKYPHQLSGGQRQRVAIVQALMRRPRVLCMDEPFSALDPGSRENMQMFLLELWQDMGMTVFFVTHDLEEAAYLGTRLLALSQYYVDDRGDGPTVARGAKIVVDHPLRPLGAVVSPAIKATAPFAELIAAVRRGAFDPDYRQHVRDFELTHPHSWQTLTDEELRPTRDRA